MVSSRLTLRPGTSDATVVREIWEENVYHLSAGDFSGGFIPEPSLFLELAAGLSAIVLIGRRRVALAGKTL